MCPGPQCRRPLNALLGYSSVLAPRPCRGSPTWPSNLQSGSVSGAQGVPLPGPGRLTSASGSASPSAETCFLVANDLSLEAKGPQGMCVACGREALEFDRVLSSSFPHSVTLGTSRILVTHRAPVPHEWKGPCGVDRPQASPEVKGSNGVRQGPADGFSLRAEVAGVLPLPSQAAHSVLRQSAIETTCDRLLLKTNLNAESSQLQ